MKPKTVIFADLDGTLLDENYKFTKTRPVLERLAGLDGSVVFCSSKTRSEIEYYRNAVGLNEPFIAENGAAIFIPQGYFSFDYPSQKTGQYNVIRLGEPYRVIRDKLKKIKEKTLSKIIGFGDMTLQELSYDSGLPLTIAKLAKKREHDEPFRILEGNKLAVMEAIKHEGLNCTQGGRYFHITGDISKGKASGILSTLYQKTYGNIHTIGVGDGPNDLPMLQAVHKPFFIQKKTHNSQFNTWMSILRYVHSKDLGMHWTL